ncbi:MAG: hypothetical protein AMXMBFR77_15390 [Phycisphaerales bacterium]|nr:hypothetical protein [Phycisphaerales bacterium]GIK19172.1 MAG: hypothetical protein BroJett004_13360 [Planctomycetota bacterium]
MRIRRTWFTAARFAPALLIGGLAIGQVQVPCWVTVPYLIDCAGCTNQTGNTCDGQPCNTEVDIEIDIKTVTEAAPGQSGRQNKSMNPAGTCNVTYRTCIENVCVVSYCTNDCVDTIASGAQTCQGSNE